MNDIVMPRLSDSMTEGTVVRWLKAPGDPVRRGEPIAEIETDKATITYESDVDGILTDLIVEVGQTVPVGTTIAYVDAVAAGAPPPLGTPSAPLPLPPEPSGAEQFGAEPSGSDQPEPDQLASDQEQHWEAQPPTPRAELYQQETDEHDALAAPGGRVKASPIARRLANKLGVDLAGVTGSGPGGRVVKEDVEAAAQSATEALAASSTPTQAPAPLELEVEEQYPQFEQPETFESEPMALPDHGSESEQGPEPVFIPEPQMESEPAPGLESLPAPPPQFESEPPSAPQFESEPLPAPPPVPQFESEPLPTPTPQQLPTLTPQPMVSPQQPIPAQPSFAQQQPPAFPPQHPAPYPPQPSLAYPPQPAAPAFPPPQPQPAFPSPPPFVQGMTGSFPAISPQQAMPPAQPTPPPAQPPAPPASAYPPQQSMQQQPVPPQQPISPQSSETATRGHSTPIEPTSAQQTVARRMAESKATAPEFFVETEVDMTTCVAYREQLRSMVNPLPSFNDFVIKAAGLALRQYPNVNAAYKDGHFEQYSDVNVGVVVSATEVLAVPTLFNVDQKGLAQIAAESHQLAEAVRTRTIQPSQLSGGTFSISNLGMYGVDRFTAILNPPQAAILAVGAINRRAVIAEDGMSLVIRQIMNMTLTCDHRILYGAEAAEFLAAIKAWLESPQLIQV